MRPLSFNFIRNRRDRFEIVGDRKRVLALDVFDAGLDDLGHKAFRFIEIRFCAG
jgi:hypothetical protein